MSAHSPDFLIIYPVHYNFTNATWLLVAGSWLPGANVWDPHLKHWLVNIDSSMGLWAPNQGWCCNWGSNVRWQLNAHDVYLKTFPRWIGRVFIKPVIIVVSCTQRPPTKRTILSQNVSKMKGQLLVDALLFTATSADKTHDFISKRFQDEGPAARRRVVIHCNVRRQNTRFYLETFPRRRASCS